MLICQFYPSFCESFNLATAKKLICQSFKDMYLLVKFPSFGLPPSPPSRFRCCVSLKKKTICMHLDAKELNRRLSLLPPCLMVAPFPTMQSLSSTLSGTMTPSQRRLPLTKHPSFSVTPSIRMQLVTRTFSSTLQLLPRVECFVVVLSET